MIGALFLKIAIVIKHGYRDSLLLSIGPLAEDGKRRSRNVDTVDLKNVLQNCDGFSGVVFRLLEYHTTAKIVLHGFAPIV